MTVESAENVRHRSSPETEPRCGVIAVLETVVAFAAVHVAYRSLQRFTDYGAWEATHGLNFIPGMVMIAASLGMICLRRKNLSGFGLSVKRWQVDLQIGLTWTLVAIVAGGLLLHLFDIRERFSGRHPPGVGIGLATLFVKILAVAVFALIYRHNLPEPPRPAFRVLNVIISVLLCATPIFAALWVGASVRQAVLSLVWMGFVAGLGEELFFRGYIQSRVNETWARPWRFLGIPFGPGLLVSSLLFGFVHALNSVDYFTGEYRFAWGYGLMTIGLFAGFVRERVGSIWPGVVMHVLGNILGLAAAIAAGV